VCDTFVTGAVDGVRWFGKNSDREPDEVQLLEVLPPRTTGGSVRCTHVSVPDVARTRTVILSRPAWMWGAEIGVNDAGVVGGNEALFTRFPVPAEGLTGMDVLRLCLERAGSAAEAVDEAWALLDRFPQGGRMGYRDEGFRYASSFLFADAEEAFVLETAGPHRAVERVTGARSISNGLTIARPDRVSPGAPDDWLSASDRLITWAAGAEDRRACTTAAATAARGRHDVFAALRDHRGHHPGAGLRMHAPCAHASFLPTRKAGQTTASLAVGLRAGAPPEVWATGTSAPCLSVFKRVGFEPFATVDGPDGLWARHEQLHRAVLQGWAERSPAVIAAAAALEAELAAVPTPDAFAAHAAALPGWTEAAAAGPRSGPLAFRWWWAR
jgi:secernin